MEFKAKKVNGHVTVDAIVERSGNNVTIHIPSFKLIEKLKREEKGEHGVRHIQSV